jgi:hypothetical protein
MIPPPAQLGMAKRAGATAPRGSPIGGIGLERNVAHIQLPG